MTFREYVGIFVLFLFVPAAVVIVRSTPAEAQTKPVWDYHCYVTMSGAMDALNNLPARKAELAKFIAFDHSMLSYCIIVPER